MNHSPFRRPKKPTRSLARIVLWLSLLLLVARLLWVLPAAFDHHRNKQVPPTQSGSTSHTAPQDNVSAQAH